MNDKTKINIQTYELNNRGQILNILTCLKEKKSVIVLCQIDEKSNKTLFQVVIKEIDLLKRRLVVETLPGVELHQISRGSIYVHSSNPTTIFKTEIRSKGSSYLEIDIPEQINVKSSRKEIRTSQIDNEITCTLHIEGIDTPITAKLIDSSNNGASFIISEDEYQAVKKDTLIFIDTNEFDQLKEKYFLVKNKSTLMNKAPDSSTFEEKFRIGGTILD